MKCYVNVFVLLLIIILPVFIFSVNRFKSTKRVILCSCDTSLSFKSFVSLFLPLPPPSYVCLSPPAWLSLSLSLLLSVSLSVSLFKSASVSVSVNDSVSVSLSLSPPPSLSLSLSITHTHTHTHTCTIGTFILLLAHWLWWAEWCDTRKSWFTQFFLKIYRFIYL